MDISPYNPVQLWDEFHKTSGSINKHLLIIYSLAVGLNAQRIMELGIGRTTRSLRAASKITGGEVYSCDRDINRFSRLLSESDKRWHLYLCDSQEFLE